MFGIPRLRIFMHGTMLKDISDVRKSFSGRKLQVARKEVGNRA
jgi:hypothetical protein